ncbi:hypothetical protein RRG08_030267 [Elysia crispata]|uniref:Uncharacterized protein n=1 Tax=Elysia crispata TaxID=231223 RepID=A0AAE1AFZ6_9GAST|nr:hypothetical protein RRG08_030267 [Elysia crispata]
MVCDNDTFVNLHEPLRPIPDCFICDCRPLCSALDTCCPHGSLQPNGTFLREKSESKKLNEFPLYQEQIECLPAPFDVFEYLQIVRCPHNAESFLVADSKEAHFRELCNRDQDKALDLDSLLLYVDVYDGLIFKNKFCALCNGYNIHKSREISWSSVDTGTSDNKIAVPWPLNMKCLHFQELYNITSELDFAEAAYYYPYCSVSYNAAPSTHQPRKCFYNRPENYYAYNSCSEPVLRLCHDLNHRYLTVSGYKNVFCAMCNGTMPILRKMEIISPIGSIEFWNSSPLSLLLGASASARRFKFSEQRECSSKYEWMDEMVGKLPL